MSTPKEEEEEYRKNEKKWKEIRRMSIGQLLTIKGQDRRDFRQTLVEMALSCTARGELAGRQAAGQVGALYLSVGVPCFSPRFLQRAGLVLARRSYQSNHARLSGAPASVSPGLAALAGAPGGWRAAPSSPPNFVRLPCGVAASGVASPSPDHKAIGTGRADLERAFPHRFDFVLFEGAA